mmetsp:Transcript_8640/g.11916  ORF Transcript_8640/g.11916 Transcript_8640/m.11916 type:complete len:203 (-) Transcript_8640:248-856(-)
MGAWMVALYVLIIVAHICYAFIPILHCCGCILFLIFGPCIAKNLKYEMEQNRLNVEKLSDFAALNECADSLTKIDADLVDSQLDKAHEASLVVEQFVGITWIIFFIEIGSFVLLCLVLACTSMKTGGSTHSPIKDEHYMRAYEQNHDSFRSKGSMLSAPSSPKNVCAAPEPVPVTGAPQMNWNDPEAKLYNPNAEGVLPQNN